MSLFGDDPVYYTNGTTTPTCTPTRRSGVLGWLGDLIGFPKQPCYGSCITHQSGDPSGTDSSVDVE